MIDLDSFIDRSTGFTAGEAQASIERHVVSMPPDRIDGVWETLFRAAIE
jgi:hypothetical protein